MRTGLVLRSSSLASGTFQEVVVTCLKAGNRCRSRYQTKPLLAPCLFTSSAADLDVPLLRPADACAAIHPPDSFRHLYCARLDQTAFARCRCSRPDAIVAPPCASFKRCCICIETAPPVTGTRTGSSPRTCVLHRWHADAAAAARAPWPRGAAARLRKRICWRGRLMAPS